MDREVENVADFTTSPRWGNKAAWNWRSWNWRSSVSESIKANTDFDGHGDGTVCVEIKILRRVLLNQRVDLHAIDVTPAR